MKFLLEGKEPYGLTWVQLHPPEWWTDETGTHDGFWVARSGAEVVDKWRKAFPNRHHDAKPYVEYRTSKAIEQWKVVPA